MNTTPSASGPNDQEPTFEQSVTPTAPYTQDTQINDQHVTASNPVGSLTPVEAIQSPIQQIQTEASPQAPQVAQADLMPAQLSAEAQAFLAAHQAKKRSLTGRLFRSRIFAVGLASLILMFVFGGWLFYERILKVNDLQVLEAFEEVSKTDQMSPNKLLDSSFALSSFYGPIDKKTYEKVKVEFDEIVSKRAEKSTKYQKLADRYSSIRDKDFAHDAKQYAKDSAVCVSVLQNFSKDTTIIAPIMLGWFETQKPLITAKKTGVSDTSADFLALLPPAAKDNRAASASLRSVDVKSQKLGEMISLTADYLSYVADEMEEYKKRVEATPSNELWLIDPPFSRTVTIAFMEQLQIPERYDPDNNFARTKTDVSTALNAACYETESTKAMTRRHENFDFEKAKEGSWLDILPGGE